MGTQLATTPRVQVKIVDQEKYWFKAIHGKTGAVHRIGLDATSVHAELDHKRNQGWIIVSGACPGDVCGGHFTEEDDNGSLVEVQACGARLANPEINCPSCGSKRPMCSKSKMSPTLCTFRHALPIRHAYHPELLEFPGGINDPKLRAIMASRAETHRAEGDAHRRQTPQTPQQQERANHEAHAVSIARAIASEMRGGAGVVSTDALHLENIELKARLAALESKPAANDKASKK